MAKARTDNAVEMKGHLCEAWFYAGMQKRLSGDSQGAQDCFAKAIATEATDCEEFVEANRKLTELQRP